MVSAAVPNTMTVPNALDIPRLTHAEASRLAREEVQRLIALVDTLEGADWDQSTDCTLWRVREMVAHLAGACASGASIREFLRQMRSPYDSKTEMMIDGINRLQVTERAGHSTKALQDEFRELGPKAADARARIPWLIRVLRIPFGPPLGVAPVAYLTDVIYPRDQWMHRADISRATKRTPTLDDHHDARMIALVVRDLALKLKKNPRYTIDLHLTGPAGGSYRFGNSAQADASITIDPVQFARLASERISPDEAHTVSRTSGDESAVRWFLENSAVTF